MNRIPTAFRQAMGEGELRRRAAKPNDRACTCHPDDNPPTPCAKRYALSECKAAAASNSQNARKQAERDAKRAAGLVRVELWAYPSDHAAIRKHAAELARAQQAKLRSVGK